jgi:hypothetical protein
MELRNLELKKRKAKSEKRKAKMGTSNEQFQNLSDTETGLVVVEYRRTGTPPVISCWLLFSSSSLAQHTTPQLTGFTQCPTQSLATHHTHSTR